MTLKVGASQSKSAPYPTLPYPTLPYPTLPYQVSVNRHFVCGDKMGLVYHVILQDHLIEEVCDFMFKSTS